jgi:mRNA-degrading endonuclease toxin of MazEF toxin-antitoxin module
MSRDWWSVKKLKVKRGDVFYANLNPVVGSEQGGVRPVLVIQNDIGNRYSPTVIVAAITSRINKAKLQLIRLNFPHMSKYLLIILI